MPSKPKQTGEKIKYRLYKLSPYSSIKCNAFSYVKYIIKLILFVLFLFEQMRTGKGECVVSTNPSAECHRSQDHLHKSPPTYWISVFAFLLSFLLSWYQPLGSCWQVAPFLNSHTMPFAVKSVSFYKFFFWQKSFYKFAALFCLKWWKDVYSMYLRRKCINLLLLCKGLCCWGLCNIHVFRLEPRAEGGLWLPFHRRAMEPIHRAPPSR